MRHLPCGSLLCAILLGLGTINAQTPAKPAVQNMQVQLTTAVKAKKAKVGDAITAITMVPVTLSQGVVVPAGSKVTGHVRKVEADSGDAHTSSIALSFEEIQIKKGQTVPVNCFIRAALMPKLQGITAQMSQGGQNMPPVTGPAAVRDGQTGDVYRDLARGDIAAADGQNSGPVAAHTGQIVGMNGVELQVAEPDHLSTFKSTHKNLELEEGLELMLVVVQ
jgi:hypothetical protein